MTLLVDSAAIADACTAAACHPYVAIDTEFARERTYWPQLCLVQVATADTCFAIDALAEADLTPLALLLDNPNVTKVLHSARQDCEIFWYLFGRLPQAVFDTQIAAMVCGFRDSVGYDKLVKALLGFDIDKSQRFTDWTKRPLTSAQLEYALDDVRHLQALYPLLAARIAEENRQSWIAEEMAILNNPATYQVQPDAAWQRLKLRSGHPAFLSAAQLLAAWREEQAQQRNLPRQWVLKDDILLKIAAERPVTADKIRKTKGLGNISSTDAAALAELCHVAKARKPDKLQEIQQRRADIPAEDGAVEMLRLLLKICCAEAQVAEKIVANSADLQAIAEWSNKADVLALHGWRLQVFGARALALLDGRLSLTLTNGKPVLADVL